MTNTNKQHPVIDTLKHARTTREFTAEPVPQAVLDDILEIARWTGSAWNRQPWSLIVVRDRAMLNTLSNVGGYVSQLTSATAAIIIAMDGPDHALDEGRLAERMCLAASAHGLGSGVAWFDDAGEDKAKTLLGIPQERSARTLVALGYATPAALAPRAKTGPARKPLSEIAHFERW